MGVIGGGSSSIQIIPELQRLEGVQLHAFVRNKVWISNRFGDHGMAQLGLALDELECKLLDGQINYARVLTSPSLRSQNPEVQR